jgi:uncharacterized membrane protein YraQ (UPF0718 family)
MDRIERKLNCIGRFVLFGIGLLSFLVVLVTERYYDRLAFGYGNAASAVLVAIITVVLLSARVPFRD